MSVATGTTATREARHTRPAMWRWPLAVLISFPIGGYVADAVVDGVDSLATAVIGGLIVGAIIGAAEWFAVRDWLPWLWIPATAAAVAAGLTVGAALVDYGVERGDLAVMGAVTGAAVGTVQALVLARRAVPGAIFWAIANPPAWALGWVVSSYVISRNIDERFPIFGASGALIFGALTGILIFTLLRGPDARAAVEQAAA